MKPGIPISPAGLAPHYVISANLTLLGEPYQLTLYVHLALGHLQYSSFSGWSLHALSDGGFWSGGKNLHLCDDSENSMGYLEIHPHTASSSGYPELCDLEEDAAALLHKSLESSPMAMSCGLELELQFWIPFLSDPQSWTSLPRLSLLGCKACSSHAHWNHRQPSSSVCWEAEHHFHPLGSAFVAKQTAANRFNSEHRDNWKAWEDRKSVV